MWPWGVWSFGQGGQKEETRTPQNMAKRQRQPRSAGYYQRSTTEELSSKASEIEAMDKRKVKPPSGAIREGSIPHIQQQVEDADMGEDWEKVPHEDLEKLQMSKDDSSQEKDGLDESWTALDQALKDNQELQRKQIVSLKRIAELEKRDKELRAIVAKKEAEVARLHFELMASSGPTSTLSTDSERYHTPYSSLSENESEHQSLFQVGSTDSDILLRLQKDNEGKDGTIKSLEGEVKQLKKKLKYAEQLEKLNFQLTTEESKHEDEKRILRREVDSLKRKASVSHHEELEVNSRLREVSQLEKEIQGQEKGNTHVDEVDDPDLNAELRRKDQHVHTLQAQVEGLQQHSKGQSKHILQLKQELEAFKEENRKLSLDVGALHREKKFLEKSMEATKARNEELEPLAQKLQAKLEEMTLKQEWAQKQLESMAQNSRNVYWRCQELEAEKRQLSEQMNKLSGFNDEYVALVNGLNAQVRKLEQEKEALQNEDELTPYKIESFSKLEEGVSKGSGSFGSIHLIEVNRIPCIAKRLHDILVGRGQTEVVEKIQKQSIEEKFHKECVFLSRLRHPNIVQFMGVHYGQDPSNLTLIMECLPMDLDKCLQQYPNIPLPTKISILLDVSYGLLHLHSQKPPIIHRDLTAANVLLTSDMKAKIADLGVSKILDLHPLHGVSQTAGPGALAYMPPEALKRVPAYDTKLDDFSFGVVALYVANQEFPMLEERGTVEALQKQETHIEKRRGWVDRVGKSHPLYKLITSCLQDVPDRRPTTSQINTSLKQLSKCHPRRFQDIMEMNQHLSRLENRISASLSDLQSQASMLKKIVEEV